MNDPRKQALIEFGAEKLADFLLDLAREDDRLSARLDWLLASQPEKLSLTRSKIADLQYDDTPINWRDAGEFESSLEALLNKIEALNPPPETGLSLVADFFRTDATVLERCDSDSTGYVFCGLAAELFAKFAKACKDKFLVAELLCDLLEGDLYGVRGSILEHAATFLSKADLKLLFDKLQKMPKLYGHKALLAELAKQMKDCEAFIRLNTDPNTGQVYRKALQPVAELFYNCGKYQQAMDWLQKIPEDEYISQDFKKKLYSKLGMHEDVEKLCRDSFYAWPTETSLAELLEVIGMDQKAAIIREAINHFTNDADFSSVRLEFLLAFAGHEAASAYVIRRWQVINGADYPALNRVWPLLKGNGCLLAASIILRKLLENILEQKRTKAYSSAARYWKELALLAKQISDWQTLPTPQDFTTEIQIAHARKSAFWSEVKQDFD